MWPVSDREPRASKQKAGKYSLRTASGSRKVIDESRSWMSRDDAACHECASNRLLSLYNFDGFFFRIVVASRFVPC